MRLWSLNFMQIYYLKLQFKNSAHFLSQCARQKQMAKRENNTKAGSVPRLQLFSPEIYQICQNCRLTQLLMSGFYWCPFRNPNCNDNGNSNRNGSQKSEFISTTCLISQKKNLWRISTTLFEYFRVCLLPAKVKKLSTIQPLICTRNWWINIKLTWAVPFPTPSPNVGPGANNLQNPPVPSITVVT